MKKIFLAIIMVLSFSSIVCAQTEAPRSTSVIIQELKDNYKAQQIYIDELRSVNDSKDITIEELQEKIVFTTNKMDEAIKDDAEKTTELIKANTKNKILIKWLITIISILGFFVIVHAAFVFLKLKFNIEVPYMLNTIL